MSERETLIPILDFSDERDRLRVDGLLRRLALDPAEVVLGAGDDAAAVRKTLTDVKERGDAAVVELARRFDDPNFTAEQIRVSPDEMRAAAERIPEGESTALRRAIAQVREYQTDILPQVPRPTVRPGVELGLRFTPLDSAGLYFPGGKAAYPSSLIMLAVPAQVAGVRRIAVCSPPSM